MEWRLFREKVNVRRISLVLLLVAALFGQSGPSQITFGDIQLPDGYSAKRYGAIDAAGWEIEGKDGFKIKFEAGPNEGSWADPDDQAKYSWYRTQSLRGYEVRYALTKPGLRTQWDEEAARALPPGNILLVTFLLHGPNSSHTANFASKISKPEELADALLIVTSFDPTKGNF